MILCEYGCGNKATSQLKNGKWCCSKSFNSCPISRKRNSASNKGKHRYWKNKKMSTPTRKKMRDAKLGEKNIMYGNTHSDKARSAISLKNTGRLSGKNNPNWKGGISREPYCYLWFDTEYKNFIKDRDGNVCLNPECSDGRYLHIHHINYNKKDSTPQNLITVCKSCNAKANFNRKWHEAWYQAIMYRRGYI